MNLEIERYEGELRQLRTAATMAFDAMDKEPASWSSWIQDMQMAKEALRQALGIEEKST